MGSLGLHSPGGAFVGVLFPLLRPLPGRLLGGCDGGSLSRHDARERQEKRRPPPRAGMEKS